MPPLSVLIKPASSACNMNCDYCFYRDVADHRAEGFRGMLSSEVLEKTVCSVMKYAQGNCSFLFQGGEPTLAGLVFYRQAIHFQKKYGRNDLIVYNSLQTNGYSMDEDWARFLAEHHFLVGLSLDGPEQLHDTHRHGMDGEGTFSRVMKTVRLLNAFGVQYNILSVLTDQTAGAIDEIYAFFRRQDFRWLQFIPCLAPLEPFSSCLAPLEPPFHSAALPLSPEAYGDFLIRIFDLWFADLQQGFYISIRHLDNWLSVLLGGQPASCGMMGRCSVQIVVEGDGSVYPCDFYVLDAWKLGNIMTDSVSEMMHSKKAEAFVQQSLAVPEKCRSCRFYDLCRNGCRRERLTAKEDNVPVNCYCEAYQRFFAARGKRLWQAAAMLAGRR